MMTDFFNETIKNKRFGETSILPNPLPECKVLGDIVFEAMGLTEEERKEDYWAVAELINPKSV